MTNNDDNVEAAVEDDSSGTSLYTWEDDRGRSFVGDGDDIARLSRLTAYAYHGEEALEADQIHHALGGTVGDAKVRINVPEWLLPLDAGDHRNLHDHDVWYEKDGVPLLLPSEEIEVGDSKLAKSAISTSE